MNDCCTMMDEKTFLFIYIGRTNKNMFLPRTLESACGGSVPMKNEHHPFGPQGGIDQLNPASTLIVTTAAVNRSIN